jgi:hypothetical protein
MMSESLLDRLAHCVFSMMAESQSGGNSVIPSLETIKIELQKCLQNAPAPTLKAEDKNKGAQIFNNSVSPKRIREVLDYDPETGTLRWKSRPTARPSWNARFTGKVAGHKDKATGYIAVRIDGKLLLAHRVAWAHMYGEWPEDEIDHRNRSGSDNRLINIRPATRNDNLGNRQVPYNSKSGVKGVSWNAQKQKWVVRIIREGKRYYFGSHASLEAAKDASNEGMRQIYGEYGRTA